jgi:hypothetical protein
MQRVVNVTPVNTIAHTPFPTHTYPATRCQNGNLMETVVSLTLSGTLEEEPDNEHLKSSHTNHEPTLDNAEVEYPSLRALYGAEIAVLACPEVLLIPSYGRQVARDLHDRFFESRGLFRGSALL